MYRDCVYSAVLRASNHKIYVISTIELIRSVSVSLLSKILPLPLSKDWRPYSPQQLSQRERERERGCIPWPTFAAHTEAVALLHVQYASGACRHLAANQCRLLLSVCTNRRMVDGGCSCGNRSVYCDTRSGISGKHELRMQLRRNRNQNQNYLWCKYMSARKCIWLCTVTKRNKTTKGRLISITTATEIWKQT